MTKKYLLYIDILGFSDMVRSEPAKVGELYLILDSLKVHRHEAFRTIVFSDTILVYNELDPTSRHDHDYVVMYACEFVQDLLYRTIRREIYFRALLRYGEFNHDRLQNIECFYGKALIDSYWKEKGIGCTGLFIHSSCQRFNKIFPMSKYDDEVSFVYLNQSLERLNLVSQGLLPISPIYLEGTDELLRIVSDVKLLENINRLMTQHGDPRVRAKFQATWHLYEMRYRDLLHALEENDFNLESICPTYDWTRRLDQFAEE